MEKNVSEADKKAKKEAHEILRIFNNICELYNNKELEDTEKWGPVIPLFQSDVQKAKRLFKHLLDKARCEATIAYMQFAGRLLIRLSHLRHNQRKETMEERVEYMMDFNKKYNLYDPEMTRMLEA